MISTADVDEGKLRMKLRLLLFKECGRNCFGCCNKTWDLDALPVADKYDDFVGWDEILLTGGEPLLKPEVVVHVANYIRMTSAAKVFVYTAKTDYKPFVQVMRLVDGMTVTLHEQSDVEKFALLNEILDYEELEGKSLRLNVFKGVQLTGIDLGKWKVKADMEWIENCPLPLNEVFMRLGEATK